MTAQTQKNHGSNRVTSKNVILSHDLSSSSEKIKLFTIAIKMKKADLDDSFIVNTVQTALEFEGVADLMNLWSEEENNKERDEIIADIQDMLDACSQTEKSEEIYIKSSYRAPSIFCRKFGCLSKTIFLHQ